jgi:hypothetical protein
MSSRPANRLILVILACCLGLAPVCYGNWQVQIPYFTPPVQNYAVIDISGTAPNATSVDLVALDDSNQAAFAWVQGGFDLYANPSAGTLCLSDVWQNGTATPVANFPLNSPLTPTPAGWPSTDPARHVRVPSSLLANGTVGGCSGDQVEDGTQANVDNWHWVSYQTFMAANGGASESGCPLLGSVLNTFNYDAIIDIYTQMQTVPFGQTQPQNGSFGSIHWDWSDNTGFHDQDPGYIDNSGSYTLFASTYPADAGNGTVTIFPQAFGPKNVNVHGHAAGNSTPSGASFWNGSGLVYRGRLRHGFKRPRSSSATGNSRGFLLGRRVADHPAVYAAVLVRLADLQHPAVFNQ